jgi:hypothetical protein
MLVTYVKTARRCLKFFTFVLHFFQNEGNVQPCILALEMIFTEVLKRREMSRDFSAAVNEHGTVT